MHYAVQAHKAATQISLAIVMETLQTLTLIAMAKATQCKYRLIKLNKK